MGWDLQAGNPIHVHPEHGLFHDLHRSFPCYTPLLVTIQETRHVPRNHLTLCDEKKNTLYFQAAQFPIDSKT